MDPLRAALIPVFGLSILVMILLAVLGLLVLFGFSLLIAFVIWRIGDSVGTENWFFSSFWKIWSVIIFIFITILVFVVKRIFFKTA